MASTPATAPILPAGFRFGVACGGFQVEGGYNGYGQPANNWFEWERESGQRGIARSDTALDFWNRYEEHLDRAVAAGCDAFRLSIEWARCEPEAGNVDERAFARYGDIVAACHRRGLMPVVALHHFTHPRWLGTDFWLRPDAPDRYAAWAALAAERLAGDCRHWITSNEPNGLAFGAYVLGLFPPGRLLGTGDAIRALDHLLAAHVLAYLELHARRPDAVVGVNNHASSVYELDRLLVDVLLARSHGVARHGLRAWLRDRRAEYYGRIARAGVVDAAVRRAAATMIPLEQALPRAVAAAYEEPAERPLDVVMVDYYSPVAADRLAVPGRRTAGGRNWRMWRMKWDEPVDPEGLVAYCRANAEPGLPLWVAENGLCNRVQDGVAYARDDGWDRVRYLRANLAALVDAVDEGLPVTAYFHWTLADNYQWGSYEHRFGLHAVDHLDGGRWDDLDAFGGDAAGTYRRLADGLRSGDRSVLR